MYLPDGMYIMSYFIYFGFFMSILGVLRAIFPLNLVNLVIMSINAGACGYVAIIWWKWVKLDVEETTAKVVWVTKIWYLVGCVSTIVFNILFLVMGGYKGGIVAIVMVVINIILPIVIGWYYFQVTVRYQLLKYGVKNN